MSYSPEKRREYYLSQKENEPLLETYRSMIQRCYNKNKDSFIHYGGRGIKVCDRWLCKDSGYINFVCDMGNRPINNTLERINVDSNYEPNNCKWATQREQLMNRRPFSDTGYKYIYSKNRKGRDFYRIVIKHLRIDTTRTTLEKAIQLVNSILKGE